MGLWLASLRVKVFLKKKTKNGTNYPNYFSKGFKFFYIAYNNTHLKLKMLKNSHSSIFHFQ
jgi:hypothetical protein